MKDCYIIDAIRSPIGKYGGCLSTLRADDLMAQLIQKLLARHPQIDPQLIEDVVVGATNQAGEDCRNIARMAALIAGLPVSVAGNTVNRLCASGMQAIMDGAKTIQCGLGHIIIAGGVENMSRAPMVTHKQNVTWVNDPTVYDSTIGWRFTNPAITKRYQPLSMGETAEILATKYNISRTEQDAFALSSHQKYIAALQNNYWNDELVPIILHDGSIVDRDENPRITSIEKLSRLKPAFKNNGTVTAGNSSPINDGGSAVLLADEYAVQKFNLIPRAVIRGMAISGVHPDLMGLGPVSATQKLCSQNNISLHDISIIELNEAFAVQVIACSKKLNIDINKINLQGGAIALGNPLGSSGARLITTVFHQLVRFGGRYGLSTMCAGLGQGSSVLMERI